jgi:N-acetylglucosaminyldiphosphoundecaprenol N-acetyl-beta-D-mannosaminyltransferase
MALLSYETHIMNAQESQFSPSAEPFVHILGSRVHLISAERTVDHIERWIGMQDQRCRQVIVTGFHGLLEAHKSLRIRSILNEAELWVPDGIAPIWLSRMRGHRNTVRAPGAEIMLEFLRRAAQRNLSSFFYGDTEQTLAALCESVARNYPGHRIAGSYSPPFRPLTPSEDAAILDRINAARPDVLWVALGMPKQDIWIHDRLKKLNIPAAIGVGAAFAFVAGTVPRCPEWMGRAGFEWVFRFLKEPKKLWRRDLLDGPQFLFHVGMEIVRSGPQMTQRQSLQSDCHGTDTRALENRPIK